MITNLGGRLERMQLRARHILVPLFEAVSNSLHAIEATDRGAGNIEIELRRDETQARLEIEGERTEPIIQIRISDDGIGFTADNMAAFDELDTEYKIRLGGKGVGRLTWLKVFEATSVESVYRTDTGYRIRIFDFRLPNGIENSTDAPWNGEQLRRTTVILSNPHQRYRDALRLRHSTVVAAIARHFLFYFLRTPSPTIVVGDSDATLAVRADNVASRATTSFEVQGNQFTAEHMKVRSPERRQHSIFYCANNRPVKEERVRNLPDGVLQDPDGSFFYHAYILSPYLDGRVNEQRTAFEIPEDEDAFEISFGEIRDQIRIGTEEYLQQELAGLAGARDAKVNRVLVLLC